MTSIAFDGIDGINANAGEEYGDWGPEIEVTQEKKPSLLYTSQILYQG